MSNRVKVVTPEQAALLNADIPEEMMKVARARVDQESQLEKVASSCVHYGAELAMQKIAEMEAEAGKSEEDKKKEQAAMEAAMSAEDKAEEKAAKETEKEAQAMGRFILQGYMNTMLEKSAQVYGDASVYIDELCKENGVNDMVNSLSGVQKQASARAHPEQQFGNLRR